MDDDAPSWERLKALRLRVGYSYRDIAQKLGHRAGSGYQSYEAPSSRDGLSLARVRKLAPVLVGKGTPPIGIEEVAALLEKPHLPFSTPGQRAIVYDLLGVELPDDLRQQVSVIPAPVKRMPVVGRVQASFWMASAPSVDEPDEYVAIPFDPDYPIEEQYALKVVGPSMNKLVQDGQYVICAKYGSSPRRIAHGKVAHVERHRRGEVEWTLKRVLWTPDGGILRPESTDPAYQEAIPLQEGDEEATILVRGIAIGSYTKFA